MKKIEEELLEENIVPIESENSDKEPNPNENIEENNAIQNIESEEVENTSSIIEYEKKEDKDENMKLEDKEDANQNVEAQTVTPSDLISSNSKKIHNKKLIIITTIIFIFVLLLLSTVFALFNSNKNTIISGVSIKGIDVSGLTKEEAYEKISSVVNNKLSTPFDLVYNDYKTTIIPEQFGVNFDIGASINTAYERGRTGNIFKNNFEIVSSLFFKVNIIPSFSYNEEAVNSLIAEMDSNLPGRLIETSYYIDGSNLIITKGIDGVKIEPDILKLKIISNISNFHNTNENIVIPVTNCRAKPLDIDVIHSEICKEPKDAYYTKEPFTVYPHVDGIDFAITIDEAKQLIQEEKESYAIPLKITSPSVTTNQIGTEAFPDLLATYSTTYNTGNVNRSTNIKLASAKIDGIVVMPGETFSYNATVGQRTAAAGFKSAPVYAGGQVTTGIGGGICQVSSTLYNSVLLSNLEIVERYNHGFNPGYVPAGRDATVSWGGPDFKFKNNRNYPIKIYCKNSGGRLTVTIYGLKEQNEYEVEIQSYITSYIQYKTITKQDSSLAKGQTKVIESGSNGCRAVAYRVLKQNGEIVSKTLLSQDTYNPHNRIVAVGTKVPVNANTSTPSTPTTAPTTNTVENETNSSTGTINI